MAKDYATRWMTGGAILAVLAASACSDSDPQDNQNTGPQCGNGLREAAEECDDADLAGTTCQDLSWNMGTLGCRADCTFDLTACVGGGPVCGNWVAEYGEACDTNDLGGATCEGAGFAPGTLGCRADCTLELAGCGPPTSCGNHVMDGPEECDGPDLAGATCASRGYLDGNLGCGANCVYDESHCTNALCGNGVAEGAEECDGADLDGHDCVMLGYTTGVLVCDEALCLFDDTGCQ